MQNAGSEGKADAAAEHGKQQRLGQQLTQKPSAAGANGQAHGEFALPVVNPRRVDKPASGRLAKPPQDGILPYQPE